MSIDKNSSPEFLAIVQPGLEAIDRLALVQDLSKVVPAADKFIGTAQQDGYLPPCHIVDSGSQPAKITRAGNYEETISVDGIPRTYRLHVPPSYNPEKPMQMVVVLHGHGQDAQDIEQLSGIDAEADKKGFIVAYPNATQWLADKNLSAWDTGNGLVPPGAHADDIGFLRELIDTTQSQMNIDSKRIYMVGVSNGGMEAYTAATKLSDKIAAVVSISGAMSGKEAPPDSPVSMMSIVGTKDDVVPPTGRTQQQEIQANAPELLPLIIHFLPEPLQRAPFVGPISEAIPELAEEAKIAPTFQPVSYATDFWKRADGISGAPTETVSNGVTTDIWQNPATGVAVEQQVVAGADHVLQHGKPAGYSMVDQAFQFLEDHPKSQQA